MNSGLQNPHRSPSIRAADQTRDCNAWETKDEGNPDAMLLELCSEWRQAYHAFICAVSSGNHIDVAHDQNIGDHANPYAIMRKIVETPARTRRGLIAKAQVALIETSEEERSGLTTHEKLLLSIADDLASGPTAQSD